MERKPAIRKPLKEPLDQEVAEAFVEQAPPSGPARILIVATETGGREPLHALLRSSRHRCVCTDTLAEARSAVQREHFDLALINPTLPDGDGLELLSALQQDSLATKCIVISASDAQNVAVEALRRGACDFITLPLNLPDLAARCDVALLRARADRQRDERLDRLKAICKKLNLSRHEVIQQVDTLCKDLVTAYQEVAEQLSEVAMASEFRTMLKQELDVEDLLRTALEYLLTKTGPTNAAVFLPDSSGHFALGAYVNYDCPRENISVLLDHLCSAVCPQMMEEREIIEFEDVKEFADWIGFGAGALDDAQVLAFSCSHREECMAVIILFRSSKEPFKDELNEMLNVLRPIFAEQIANVIRIHHRASPQWPKDAHRRDDDYDFNDESDYGFGLAA